MLIKISIENFKSFDQKEELSMVSSSKMQGNKSHRMNIKQTQLLKNTNWNSRPSDQEEQIEPFRKYFFICEGANTETFYFKRLIDLRKQLGIHPLIDIRLREKTDDDKNLSFPKNLVAFAESQKNPENDFDDERDKMVIAFDVISLRKRCRDMMN